MSNESDFNEIDRYLSGEANAAERQRVEARAASDRSFAALLRAARSDEVVNWDTDAAWRKLSARLEGAAPVRHRWRFPVTAVAALFVVALGLVAVGRMIFAPSKRELRTAVEYLTGAGERKTVVLPDHSTVELAPTSQLSLTRFSNGERIVTLAGEAFFEVTHDAAHPFIVRSAVSETRVLGTSFDVSAYPGAPTAHVAVASGRVRVLALASRDSAVLNPGQVARIAPGIPVTVQSVDVAQLTAWRSGKLVFRDQAFKDVAPTLERWYGIQLVIADSTLARTRLSALFQQQPLNEVLDAIAATLDARYERSGARVTFFPK